MMKRLLLDLLWSHLRSLGAFGHTGQTMAAARETAGLLPMYDAWFDESVRLLEVGGYLRRRGERILTDDAPSARSPHDVWRDWETEKPRWQRNPDLAAIHRLLETTLPAIPAVLTGERRATEIMFPKGSLRLVEDVYKTNPASAFFNRVLAEELISRLRARTEAEPGFAPRILEIGAGTGATSAAVLEAIRADGLAVREYCYTDLSRAFLDHAERNYRPASPFLTCRILDIERPVAEQGIAIGSYDIVIAANVLHATRDIRATLRNAKAPLTHDGLLVLNEITANVVINHFTFGLLEGWWRYDDAELRIPGSPLLTSDSWQRLLAEEGYGQVTFPATAAADLGQHIIVARSNGIVRQAISPTRAAGPDPVPNIATPPLPEPARVASGDSVPDGSRARVEAVIREILAESLRIDGTRIAREANFSAYGVDSIFAVQLARTIGARLGLDLDVTLLFEYSTLSDLGAFLVAEYAAELAAAPDDSRAPGHEQAEPEGMAIVGMSARFPGAEDVGEFWRIVEQGARCITTPPMRRKDWASHGDTAHTTGLWGGFLDGIHEFDPLFFAMSMTEARQVTPELRLMLMAAWNAVEDAGYRITDLRTRPTGVFVATTGSEYDGGPSLLSSPVPALIPNRISYAFDLRGPSEQCDTTCSSSLVALHRAIRSIREGECEQALVGGVNLVMSPARFAGMRGAGMLSAEGNVRPFQQDAEGTVRSEGAGAVLIKPLRRAIEDGDTIYGIVRGTGVAHGGQGVSFTAPSIRGMKSAIARAFDDAGTDPGAIEYVEAHGMSSALADSVEIAALRASLGTAGAGDAADSAAIYFGSVKPCIGHSEVFSGLAALVKTVQAVRFGVIPAIPDFGGLHADIALGTRLRPATVNRPWPVRTDGSGRVLPRRASINSFGIGGVNAHVVLEQYVPGSDGGAAVDGANLHVPQLVILSAKTGQALRERARRLLAPLRETGPETWPDLAYTLQVGREEMECRLALVAATPEEAAEVLAGWLEGDPDSSARVALTDHAGKDPGAVDFSAVQDGSPRLSRQHLTLLAEQWVAGAHVDWGLLHREARRRRIPLPAYPFARRTCFAAGVPERPATPALGQSAEVSTVPVGTAGTFVSGLVASVLGLEEHEIDRRRSLAGYGLNSLLLVAVLGRIRGEFPLFQPDWLHAEDTLDDVVARLSSLPPSEGLPSGARFPELVHLNGVTTGRPVFWVHGALAGVESYHPIAAKIPRPFYGIQARGFLTDHAPLQGVPAMAEYYVEVIRGVQPEGPYDVGGFCLGGILAYEITRLLQLRGQVVNSLTMVDSPDNSGWAVSNASGSGPAQSAALQVVNSLLWPAGEKNLARVTSGLIHQNEIADAPDPEACLRRLADLAAERGLAMAREHIVHFVRRNIEVQLAYRIDEYRIRPLVRPDAVECTYFRNRRALFLGDLEPYFQVVGETFSLDHVDYVQDWKRELPGLRVVDIDASNHMTILHDDLSLAAIEQACVTTYLDDLEESR
ncbi:beta-ketoacyl synthase N-terminal-like domain-containing protein [Nocardia sp. NPDC051030]|uniref:beta-ketoacyl synthase N-terminal-like domain-containing protein n=1 Tax=Nocardia sp. NPDC051030 TaxID=3155162 RepID=UPI0034295C26